MSENPAKTRCGFVSVLGLPNAGKSTLVNVLVGSKVSIVSAKVQTTRCRILGIAMQDNAQIILLDTPGIFHPKKNLEKAMVEAAWQTVSEAEAIIHIIDATAKGALESNQKILERLPKHMPCLLVLNKTDKVKKPDLLVMAQAFNERFSYAATYMISALKENGTQDLKQALAGYMPENPYLFDPEQTSDMPMRFLAAEITREKIFNQLYQELPYDIFVETESWEQQEKGGVEIGQVIYVQRDSQKAIVLGKKGARIKQIGQEARLELEEIMQERVHLKLFVKVQENWDERSENYAHIGLASHFKT